MLKLCTSVVCIAMILGLTHNSFARTIPSPLANKTHYAEFSAKQFLQGSASAFMKTNGKQAASMQQGFMISAEKMQAVFAQPGVVTLHDFPIAPQVTGTLELVPARSPITQHTQIWVATKNGPQLYTSLPSMQCYKGFIRDEADSKVFLNVVNGEIVASITHGDGSQYTFSPVADAQGDQQEHVIISNEALDALTPNRSFECLADQTKDYYSAAKDFPKQSGNESTLASGELLQFDLAVETSTAIYTKFNKNVDKIAAYLNVVYAMVSSIYEDEINVTYNVSYICMWTDAAGTNGIDPYRKDGNIGGTLDEFAEFWKNNRADVNRDIAQLVTGQGTGSGPSVVGGIAFRNALCQKGDGGGYSVVGIEGGDASVYPTMNYTWDVMVIAHELGHNFAARHTHDCWWNPPLDTCVNKGINVPGDADGGNKAYLVVGDACFLQKEHAAHSNPGTIMSYCHLINGDTKGCVMTFSPPVIKVIRDGADAAPCLTIPHDEEGNPIPRVLLQRPLGKETLKGNGTVEIRWTSSLVNNVRLQYSIDGGGAWINISDNPIPASNRVYQWQVPVTQTTKGLVRIVSATDESVADTSMALFTIEASSLALTTPKGGERLGQGKTYAIKWSAFLIPKVNILFSQNNGQDWNNVKADFTGTSYTWSVPMVVTSQALIRVEDATDHTIISQSAPFAIGVPTVTLTSPVGGEKWDKSSKKFPITWSSDFVQEMRVEYSLNNGGNWSSVSFSSKASDGMYGWTTPSAPSTQVLVRITGDKDPNIVAVSGVFEILNQVSVSEYFEELPSDGVSVIPNPINQTAEIRYQTKAFVKQLHITVRDLTGKVVADLGTIRDVVVGEHSINMDSSPLANGVYFLSLDAGRAPVMKQITVIR